MKILPSLVIITFFANNEVKADEEDDGGLMECLPQLADRCFNEMFEKLPCRLKNTHDINSCQYNYTNSNTELKDFCDAMEDSLTCSSDIIDTGCSVTDGRDNFDKWLSGLQAVSNFICQNPEEPLKDLSDNANCWDLSKFIDCVKLTSQWEHIVDIMRSELDINECITLITALSECNMLSAHESNDKMCKPIRTKDVVGELIHVFFSRTKCNSRSSNEVSFGYSIKVHQYNYTLLIAIYYFIIILTGFQ